MPSVIVASKDFPPYLPDATGFILTLLVGWGLPLAPLVTVFSATSFSLKGSKGKPWLASHSFCTSCLSAAGRRHAMLPPQTSSGRTPIGQPQFKSLWCLFLAVWPWISHSTSLIFHFLIYKKKVKMSIYRIVDWLGNNGYKVLNAVPDTRLLLFYFWSSLFTWAGYISHPRLLHPFLWHLTLNAEPGAGEKKCKA